MKYCVICNARRAANPFHRSIGLIDSQSVKTTHIGGESRGYDGGKKIKGRKRHIITDTNGWLLSVIIHPANGNGHDSQTGFEVMDTLRYRFERMQKIYADGGYRGESGGHWVGI